MDDTFMQHVPQESRRHKLRFFTEPQQNENNNVILENHTSAMAPGGLNLTLSSSTTSPSSTNTHARVFTLTPVGPFTGYASILGRSKFLRPAQELLEGFSSQGNNHHHGSGNVVSVVGLCDNNEMAKKLLEESGSWFGEDEEDDVVSRTCSNPTLLSMLHEVYKRYKLYCQQMHSAVTSFESVAGLGNAAPFICLAIKNMFRHFHCLKSAILDQIRVTSKVYSSVDVRKGSTSGPSSYSEDKLHNEQKRVLGANFLQHPAWRSQRGFPDKAVTVLRTWLFEHFLHPYPTDSDKQMLAQKTGLSRSQVSNWFTNARVRLWKPMVEEMHTLEKKAQCSRASNAPDFAYTSSGHFSVPPQPSQNDVEIHTHRQRDQTSHCKRSRIEVSSEVDQNKVHYATLLSYQVMGVDRSQAGGRASQSSQSPNLGINQNSTTGVSWSSPGQIVPFWLAKQ